MTQWAEAMDRIDRLLKTKLDELVIVLLMMAGSFALVWFGKISGGEWVAIVGLTFGVWRGETAFRQSGAVRGALSSAASMVASMAPRPASPAPPPPADDSGPGG